MKEYKPLISIIVPIYNIAPYLYKCLDSLVSQTMKQIEVICVDDGSTDNSGNIADEYDKKYDFFRTFHTENKGLSAARNFGIKEAKADWIMLVDGDDWVDKEFCRIPYKYAIENNADMVIFDRYQVKNEQIIDTKRDNYDCGIVNEMTAHEFGGNIAWNKLYNKTLFENIMYPEGRVYEDIATTHKLVHTSKCRMLIRDKLYYHVNREGSITNTHNLEIRRDGSLSVMERCTDLISYGYPEEKIQDLMCAAAIGILAYTVPENNIFYEKAKGILNSINMLPKNLPIKKKAMVVLWKIHPSLFNITCNTIECIRMIRIGHK